MVGSRSLLLQRLFVRNYAYNSFDVLNPSPLFYPCSSKPKISGATAIRKPSSFRRSIVCQSFETLLWICMKATETTWPLLPLVFSYLSSDENRFTQHAADRSHPIISFDFLTKFSLPNA
jgi:hypothetical protein